LCLDDPPHSYLLEQNELDARQAPLIVSSQYPIGRSASTLEADKATVFDGLQVEIRELTHRLSTDRFFWLDIDGASAEELQTVASVLQIAEPASSWLPRFGQRARFEVDEQQIRISTFAPGVSGLPIEGHILHGRGS
jgi:Mg2+ and Co2+ transporter CorA